ncbi:MAG: hypothetical protein ACOH1V_13680 [Stenotrophomonas sp.]
MLAVATGKATEPKSSSPLWVAFWLYGVIPSNLLWAAALWSDYAGPRMLTVALFCALLAFTAWIIPVVWRAAPNAATPIYGVAARGLTVAWGLNTLFVIFFLGIQLFSQ